MSKTGLKLEVVRVLFVTGACERETVAYSGVVDAGVSGGMVHVERRFGTAKAPQRVIWLSDNGSALVAKAIAKTAPALGPTLLFTPIRSLERTAEQPKVPTAQLRRKGCAGMFESFVKTSKRDYIRASILQLRIPDVQTDDAKPGGDQRSNAI